MDQTMIYLTFTSFSGFQLDPVLMTRWSQCALVLFTALNPVYLTEPLPPESVIPGLLDLLLFPPGIEGETHRKLFCLVRPDCLNSMSPLSSNLYTVEAFKFLLIIKIFLISSTVRSTHPLFIHAPSFFVFVVVCLPSYVIV